MFNFDKNGMHFKLQAHDHIQTLSPRDCINRMRLVLVTREGMLFITFWYMAEWKSFLVVWSSL